MLRSKYFTWTTRTTYRVGMASWALAMLLAVAIVAALFAWEGHVGLSLWDEGFLWYGAQRVMLGEVPGRDFMAYDPGRYYWSATLMSVVGDNGIVALRMALALVQLLGLFLALLLVRRTSSKSSVWTIVLAAGVFALWMYPRHKLFDITLSIALVGALTFLIAQPSTRRCFAVGVVVGLAAFFGRNHGVYGALGSAAAISYLVYVRREIGNATAAFGWWLAGICIGYGPMILMVALVSGYAGAFWESILFLFEVKATNLPLPVPWPWSVRLSGMPVHEVLRGIVTGSLFIALLAFGILGLGALAKAGRRGDKPQPAVIASILLALPYAHYAFSRADVGHLAQGIFPFLTGALCVLADRSVRAQLVGVSLLLGASMLVMLPQHPAWQARMEHNWVVADIGRDRLKVDSAVSAELLTLHRLSDAYSPRGETFIATPFWPGAYAVLDRKAPMWEIYALFPHGAEFQATEIERIRKADPAWAIVMDVPLDGRNALRFRNTHPMIDRFIRDEFVPVEVASLPSSLQVYERRQAKK